MTTFLDLDDDDEIIHVEDFLSKLSLSSPFEPKLVHRDNDFTRRFETFTAVDRPWSSFSTLSTFHTYKMTSLDNDSDEFQRVKLRIRQNIASISLLRRPCLKLIEIRRIENAYLWHQFCLKRAFKMKAHPSTRVMELFHGTREGNVDSICKHNLDWRRMGSTRYLGNKYGSGVSFSPCFHYASQFPRGEGRTMIKTMLLCDVLVYRKHDGHQGTRIPEKGYDTTTSPNGKVVVKYDDNEFYPKYLIKYSNV